MKKVVTLLFLVLAASAVALAQDNTTTTVYAMKNQTERLRILFHQQQYLRRQADTLHLIKVDIEWPLSLNYSPLSTLHRFLTKELFGRESEAALPALEQYLTAKGEPLTLMPDEPGLRTCYEMVSLSMMEYVEGRYVSLRLANRTIPKDTAEQVSDRQRLITYDMINDRVLTTKEMLKNSAVTPGHENYMQLQMLLMGALPAEEDYYYDDFYLGDMCLMRIGAYFDLGYVSDDDDYNSLAAVPETELEHFLNKETKRMLKAEIPERQPEPCTPQPWFSDTTQVYVVAEEPPSFRESTEDIYRYLNANIRYPWLDATLGIEGRVVVQFIVEADGTVSSPSVVHSVSPGIDREAVRLILSMPRWTPARQQGQPVRYIQSLPITFKITT